MTLVTGVAMHESEQRRSTAAEMWGKFRALGGPHHLLDGAAPAIGFLLGYATVNAKIGVLVALGVAGLISLYRLLKGDSVKVVSASLATVVVFSLFVGITGEGRGFYLPDLLICAVCTLAFAITLLTGRPLSHWACRKLGLERGREHERDARVRLHRKVSLAWLVFWAAHLVIMVPLYVANKVVALGTVALVLGKPALVVMLALTWLWVRRRSPQAGEPSLVTADERAIG
ncbi:DUF3159 domain-containing protein [Nocardia sp. CDC153]|uniref:DUF3159 domain-containing protein n=1 Tax=Nocardia sp. CDC153 TaxID=3112167 RepID=UPI002DBDCC86|nr:DUF3159 domain-containing protein [Nocardia sp. CDC153]MEC3952895.1 DUF3159 domain-containing protein [Nocardia sp. CDC153]